MTRDDIAFKAGYAAAENNSHRAPATCSIYMDLIKDEKIGGAGAGLAMSWLAGFDKQVDEVCAKILAG